MIDTILMSRRLTAKQVSICVDYCIDAYGISIDDAVMRIVSAFRKKNIDIDAPSVSILYQEGKEK